MPLLNQTDWSSAPDGKDLGPGWISHFGAGGVLNGVVYIDANRGDGRPYRPGETFGDGQVGLIVLGSGSIGPQLYNPANGGSRYEVFIYGGHLFLARLYQGAGYSYLLIDTLPASSPEKLWITLERSGFGTTTQALTLVLWDATIPGFDSANPTSPTGTPYYNTLLYLDVSSFPDLAGELVGGIGLYASGATTLYRSEAAPTTLAVGLPICLWYGIHTVEFQAAFATGGMVGTGSSAKSYRLRRALAGTSDYSDASGASASPFLLVDTTADAGTAYDYRVRVIDRSSGAFADSAPVSVTTRPANAIGIGGMGDSRSTRYGVGISAVERLVEALANMGYAAYLTFNYSQSGVTTAQLAQLTLNIQSNTGTASINGITLTARNWNQRETRYIVMMADVNDLKTGYVTPTATVRGNYATALYYLLTGTGVLAVVLNAEYGIYPNYLFNQWDASSNARILDCTAATLQPVASGGLTNGFNILQGDVTEGFAYADANPPADGVHLDQTGVDHLGGDIWPKAFIEAARLSLKPITESATLEVSLAAGVLRLTRGPLPDEATWVRLEREVKGESTLITSTMDVILDDRGYTGEVPTLYRLTPWNSTGDGPSTEIILGSTGKGTGIGGGIVRPHPSLGVGIKGGDGSFGEPSDGSYGAVSLTLSIVSGIVRLTRGDVPAGTLCRLEREVDDEYTQITTKMGVTLNDRGYTGPLPSSYRLIPYTSDGDQLSTTVAFGGDE